MSELDANLGIRIKWYDGKGRGIEAIRKFNKDDFIVEYAGDLIKGNTAIKQREEKYAEDASIGSYTYHFKYEEKNYW